MIIFTEWEHSVLHFYSNSAPEGCHPCHHGGLQPCFPLPLPSLSLFLCLFPLCLSVGLPPVCSLCLCLSFPPSFSLCHPLSPLLLSVSCLLYFEPHGHSKRNRASGRPSFKANLFPVSKRKKSLSLLQSPCVQFFVTVDDSPPGSSVYGIFQARIQEWVAISFSWGSSQPRDQTCRSCIGRQILYP